MQPIDQNDCIEEKKFVIVLRIDPVHQFSSRWYFLSKNKHPQETTQQNQIKVCNDLDEAEFILGRLKAWSQYENAFIHPVTVQTRVSIWGNWSIPQNCKGVDS